MNLISLVLNIVKYLSVGFLIWVAGTLFFGNSMNFTGRSEPAQLYVWDMQSRRNSDGQLTYRPVFKLETAKTSQQEYAGNAWNRIPPHQVGEVVAGRYDPENGEMRSNKMLQTSTWLGWIARVFGALVGLQAVALIFGVPEYLLPLRIRVGSRRQTRQIWQ